MRRRGERGQMVPLMALCFVVLIGAMAIATDLSVSTHYKRNIQNVTDAASLAGAKVLPAKPAFTDEEAATSAALALVHNSFPWTGTTTAALVAAGCNPIGAQCSVTVCAGMTSVSPPCTVPQLPAANGTQFVLTVNAPPKTAVVQTFNQSTDPYYRDRIEVVMHQKSGAFFTGLFGSTSDQDGAQSVAYHFAANQPFPFALFSSTVIGDGNSPEIIAGNVYASRYVAPQGNGHAAVCAAPYVDPQLVSHPGFIVLGAPQEGDAAYTSRDGQYNDPAVPPGSDPILTGQDCSTIGAGVVGMSAIVNGTNDCQAASPGLVYDAADNACEANPAITPPAVAPPPYIPVYASKVCGATGLVGGVYQPGEYECASGTSLTIDHPMAKGFYEIDAVSNSGCDVVMNASTPSTLTGVTFLLKGGAGICANPPSGTTITQTPFDGKSGLAGDGVYDVLSDSVGNPSITMNTTGGGSTSGTWNLSGVIWLPTGTVNIANKDALVDSGQIIIGTWNDTSGYHQDPSVTYNAGILSPQPEVLQLAE
jgi:Flp pilus assembly protein TadG